MLKLMRKAIPAVTIVIFVLYIMFFSPIFKIKKGTIENTDCLSENFIEKTAVLNKNIFLTSTDKIKSDLKNKYPCIADVEVKKIYPSTISVKVIKVKTVLKIDGSDLALSENNIVIKNNGSDITPVLFSPQGITFTEGQKVTDKTILFITSLAADIQKSDFLISNIRLVEGGSIALYSRDESVAIFTQTKDAREQVDSLQAILAKAKIDSSKIEKIDLRFDKPILVFKQKQ